MPQRCGCRSLQAGKHSVHYGFGNGQHRTQQYAHHQHGGEAASTSNIYLLLASDEQTTDVTIETLDDGDNVFCTQTVPNVSFKRNRVTILTDAIYTNSNFGSSFQVENT